MERNAYDLLGKKGQIDLTSPFLNNPYSVILPQSAAAVPSPSSSNVSPKHIELSSLLLSSSAEKNPFPPFDVEEGVFEKERLWEGSVEDSWRVYSRRIASSVRTKREE
jgi:hypothetical protein